MNVTTRRVVSIVATVALVAAVVATTTTPAYAKKPAGNDKKQPDFQVETDVTHYYNGWVGWHDQEGAFVATGMINDTGPVVEDYPFGDAFFMTLSGQDGEIDVFVQITKFKIKRTKHEDTTKYRGHFEVVGGTGAYADLEASGSASGVEQWILIDPIWIIEAWTTWQLDGFVTSW